MLSTRSTCQRFESTCGERVRTATRALRIRESLSSKAGAEFCDARWKDEAHIDEVKERRRDGRMVEETGSARAARGWSSMTLPGAFRGIVIFAMVRCRRWRTHRFVRLEAQAPFRRHPSLACRLRRLIYQPKIAHFRPRALLPRVVQAAAGLPLRSSIGRFGGLRRPPHHDVVCYLSAEVAPRTSGRDARDGRRSHPPTLCRPRRQLRNRHDACSNESVRRRRSATASMRTWLAWLATDGWRDGESRKMDKWRTID